MTKWAPQQSEALALIGAWLRLKYTPTFYLAGYAGTGKTTLAMEIASHARGEVAFAAFTGKAARVMQSKGCDGAQTIHSLIYAATIMPSGDVVFSLRDSIGDYGLIIIDECSMVNEEIGKDLLSFGIPVLVLGDPAQLPPVTGGGYFTSKTPDYMLTEVHRQAAESPIVRLATDIRMNQMRLQQIETEGLRIVGRSYLNPADVTGADIVLVGRNYTRQRYNERLRKLAGIERPLPQKGEPLICLRNDKKANIFNGDILTVASARYRNRMVSMEMIDPDGGRPPAVVRVHKDFFSDDMAAAKLPYSELSGTQQFTYGYAITCHKSQGSQWDNVCVFNESSAFGQDRARWLYTAVTRAAEHLTLVI